MFDQPFLISEPLFRFKFILGNCVKISMHPISEPIFIAQRHQNIETYYSNLSNFDRIAIELNS